MKRKLRVRSSPSSITSAPRMSVGIRSGVNCTRSASSPRTMPRVSTSLVFASPGTPMSNPWPPASKVTSVCSTTRSWPKITAPTASRAAATRARLASAAFTRLESKSATVIASPGAVLRVRAPRSVVLPAESLRESSPNGFASGESRTRLRFRARRLTPSISQQRLPANKREIMAEASESGAAARPPDEAFGGLREVAQARKRGPAPVHLWNPPYCGEIDMRIAADGTWFYCGSPIGRPALVQLFASILRKDEGGYVLVTPVERVGIRVDDAPFLAVEMILGDSSGEPTLTFRTNVEDIVT